MARESVKFKGVKDGVFIYIDSSSLEEVKREIDEKLREHGDFYAGVRLLNISSETLSERDIIEIKLLLKYKYDLIVLDEDLPKEIFEKKEKVEEKIEDIPEEDEGLFEKFEGIDTGITKFFYGTIRSGQELYFNGNIVIIGDVNPGAFVIATGNIIVMGNFRGVAHVGANGNDEAILACYNLAPIQVRINNTLAIKPDEEIEVATVPEIVMMKNGEVVIVPYLPNK
ncbi:MAG: septum site-determining protein MinC [Tissierellia bacterium]|nr:septum site-determining protein MinC [Tissierellia bacterium]